MLPKILKNRLEQGNRTSDYPESEVALPERFRGRPELDPSRCVGDMKAAIEACPTQALSKAGAGPLALDLGRCVFCAECVKAAPQGAIRFTNDYRLASTGRDSLILRDAEVPKVRELDARMRSLFGRSLKLRQVSAGGCSGCEAELTALGNVVFDLGRFGVQFVASPRHADGLVITGPVTKHMEQALKLTYEAVPGPKLVIAVGACAISGGPFIDSPEARNGASSVVPVDLYIPGCPPHPLTVLDGLLRLLGRLDPGNAAR